jgi:cytidylate kinase
MKKTIITIAGKLGSGKSSTGKRLAQELGYEHRSTGDFARQIAKEHGFTITEWNKHAEQHPELDEQVDTKSKDMKNDNNVILDSRLAFHFIPDSFKVFLDIDSRVAAQRIYNDLDQGHRAEEHQAESIEDMVRDMDTRVQSEIKRYQELYGVNHHDHENFDLVINTGLPENNLENVVAQIKSAYEAWLEQDS